MKRLLLSALLVSAAAAPLAAQNPGDRVRVTVPAGEITRRHVGVVESITPSVLVLRQERTDERVELPLEVIAQLQVSEGTLRGGERTGASAATGAGVGALLGFTAGFFLTQEGGKGSLGSALPYAGGGLAVGVLGGVLMAQRPREGWRTVQVPRRAAVAPVLAPHREGGTAVGLSLTF